MDDFEYLKRKMKLLLDMDVDQLRKSFLKRRIDGRLFYRGIESYSEYAKLL